VKNVIKRQTITKDALNQNNMCASKRMISLQIVDTDAFLDMPLSTQALYFHLLLRADDEGFINNPKKILRLIGCQDDDMKILLGKRFILSFENGIVVIKHWLIHNTIRMDRFNKTVYTEEKKLLFTKENKAYTLDKNKLATTWQPNGNHLATQVKLSKVKLSKDNKNTYIQILEYWNKGKVITHSKVSNSCKNEITKWLKEYSLYDLKKAIKSYAETLYDDDCYFSHKWTLEEFIKRGNGARVFLYKSPEDYKK